MELNANARLALMACAVGGVAGIVVGFVADRIASRLGEEACDGGYSDPDDGLDGDHVDKRVITRREGYADGDASPQVSPAFEKPDISKVVDYTKFSAKEFGGSDEDGDGDGADIPEVKPEPVAEMITQEEFLKATGNEDGYVSVVGTWFEEDRILAGWNEDLDAKDVEENLGWDIISAFDDPEVGAVYARNKHLKVLYEIIRGVGAYKDSVEEG